MGLPDGALYEIWDEDYWAEVERRAEHERQFYTSIDPCPGCFHLFCECA